MNIYSVQPEQKYLCDCKHRKQIHTPSGGCLVRKCECEHYSQLMQVVNPEYKSESSLEN